jgi:hypothetical protein
VGCKSLKNKVKWSEVKIGGLVNVFFFVFVVVFVVFVVAGCIVYVLAVVGSFIVVFLYCVCALFVCNVCYLSVVLLYYCHRVKAQLRPLSQEASASPFRQVNAAYREDAFSVMCQQMQVVCRLHSAGRAVPIVACLPPAPPGFVPGL